MAQSRTKNAIRNIGFGFANRFVVLILPFITRTIILYLLGASYLGIGTLFSSVLSFLSLTELGLSSAIVHSMYKPIAEKDTDTICALLKFYRKIYRIIGFIILGIGTLLVPAIPFLIKGNPPEGVNIYILFYLYLINSVISYFFSGYKQSLLAAHQRSDIKSNIATFVNIGIQAGQILVLLLTKSLYIYALVPICGTIATNGIIAFITQKKYPEYNCRGNIDDEVKQGIKGKLSGLFGTKLNSIVVHSSDTIIVSAFLGLTMTAQYGNYYYIMNAVCGFIMVFYSSLTAGIGNKLVTDSLEENYTLFKNLSFINAWMVGWCSVCFLCLFEPFMELWVGEDLKLGILFVILLVVYFFIYEIQRTILTFKDAAGLWSKDKFRPYVSMVTNVTLNIVLVQFIGIYGIVASTIFAFMISLPWANRVLFKNLFRKNSIVNLLEILRYLLITAFVACITFALCSLVCDGFWGLIIRIAICIVLPNLLFALVFSRTKEFKFMIKRIKSFVKK